MKETARVKERISALEQELKSKISETPKLEEALASCYENGADPGKASNALSEHKDRVTAMVAALRGLDERLYNVQKAERDKLSAEIRHKAEDDFKKAMKAAASALKPLRKSLSEILDKSAADELTGRIVESLKTEIWNVIDEAAQERFVQEVPCSPSLPPQRDDQGEVMTAQLAFRRDKA
ncbi:MAG: hypothetical protein SVR04_02520 [Spirochaetota bacterium]|nr:hypothetical protein [Spirochaetota bacterium]